MNNSNLGMMRALGGSIGPNAIIEETENDVNLNINDETDTDSKYKNYRNKVKNILKFLDNILFIKTILLIR